jgi:DNA-binding transcriptional MerR regulator
MEGYTQKQVAEITGLKSRLVKFYTEQGVVTPGVSSGAGRGTFRRYSEVNLIEFGIINQLTSYGITVHIIKDIFEKGFTRNDPEYPYYLSGLWEKWENERTWDYFLIVYSKDGEIVKYYPINTSQEKNYLAMRDRDSALVLKLNSIFEKVRGLKANNTIDAKSASQKAKSKSNKKRKKIDRKAK